MKLPKGWKIGKVGCLFDVQLGKMLNETARTTGEQQPYLTNCNVQWGRFDLSKLNEMHFSERDKSKFTLKKGDLVVCEGGEVGRCAIWREEISPCFFQKTLHRLRPTTDEIVTEFMFAYMSYISCSKRVSDLTTQSSIAHLTREQFCKLDVILPPLPEQRKIAEILGAWDEALEKLDALIAAKELRKKGLMQQLLTGKRRVKGFTGKWERTTFGNLLQESRNPGSHGLFAQKITVKLYGKGVYAKQERMSGSENTKYFVRHTGQFIYSKLDFLNGAFGIVPPSLEGFESTQDLPAFDVAKKCDGRWLLAYVVRPEFYTRQLGAAAGGRKARRVNPPEFLALPVNLPALPEQRAIADILDTGDEELRLLRATRTAVERQKRGLMQRLLTGETRVENTDTRTNKDKQGQTRTGVREGLC